MVFISREYAVLIASLLKLKGGKSLLATFFHDP